MSTKDDTSTAIICTDKLVHLAALETGVHEVRTEEDRFRICAKMCEMAKDDGVVIINETNTNLCGSCELYAKPPIHK